MEYNFADVIKTRQKIYARYCSGYCYDCPLGASNNGHDVPCGRLLLDCPEDYAKIVMDWAEAHKPKTNSEVAREMLEEKFGIKFDTSLAGCDFLQCKGGGCIDCHNRGFWDKEYAGE